MSDPAPRHAGRHPTVGQYVQVAICLTLITLMELGIILDPVKEFFRANMVWVLPGMVPMLLLLSAIKFLIVVGFYMHLKFDANYYRAVLGGPLLVALIIFSVLGVLYGTSLLQA